jgi:hypothetical protein
LLQLEADMKKTLCMALATVALLLTSTLGAQAAHDGFGGGHGGYGWHGGYGGHGGVGVWFGPGWLGSYYPYYPIYPYYPYYPNYEAPAVVYPQQPDVYVQPAPEPEKTYYWYYCKDPNGYYPYVKKCPGGWKKVTPTPAPADFKE